MDIPNRLKDEGIRFVLIRRGEKSPFQKEWTKKNINYKDIELIQHIKSGGNYGVIGGGPKNLIIVDFDNQEVQDQVLTKIPPTFTVKTGTGKYHTYFYTDGKESYKILDKDKNTIADIQAEGKQVVGPGSVHPNGNYYSVIKDLPIAFISYAELKAILMPYDTSERNINYKIKNEYKNNKNDFIEKVKMYLSVEDVLKNLNIDTTKNPTQCPLHDSKGGKCLGFDREVWHCFHCDERGNIFTLIQKTKGVDFNKALEYLSEIANLSEELKENKKQYILNKEMEKMSGDEEKKEVVKKYLTFDSEDKDNRSEVLVEYIKTKLKIFTVKDDQKTEMWVYCNGIYIPNGSCEIQILLRDILGVSYNAAIAKRVIDKIIAETYIEHDSFFSICYKDEVLVENGILNIFTRELKPFDPNKIFFNKMPVLFNPNAKAPKIDEFLNSVLSKEDDKKVFYEIAGFALLSEYKYEKAFMFVGEGRNGKTKSLELLKMLVGISSCAALPIYALKGDSFCISELFGKKLNIAGDLNSGDLKETGTFKQLTGRDVIDAKRKFLNNIRFVNHAKMLFACNTLPRVYDYSLGFWGRWILLEFPYTFVSQEEYDSREDLAKLKIKDPDIIKKITTEEEMSGFLNYALDGLKRLEDNNGNFSYTIGTADIKNTWIRKSDSFTAFAMDKIEESYDSYIVKSELRREYSLYCREHKIKGRSDVAIKNILQEMYGVSEERIVTKMNNGNLYGEQENVWKGIKWK